MDFRISPYDNAPARFLLRLKKEFLSPFDRLGVTSDGLIYLFDNFGHLFTRINSKEEKTNKVEKTGVVNSYCIDCYSLRSLAGIHKEFIYYRIYTLGIVRYRAHFTRLKLLSCMTCNYCGMYGMESVYMCIIFFCIKNC